jgi:hypothetical protein
MTNVIERADFLRLEEIRTEMLGLLEEAVSLIPNGPIKNQAKRTWYANIKIELTDDHGYLTNSDDNFENTLAELEMQMDEEGF